MRTAHALLAGVSEPNDARLGFSSRDPAGLSIGATQSHAIVRALADSRAVETGYLSDLADCELVITGIGRDKISDITISVLRRQLIKYTREQCDNVGIPTRRIPSGRYWDSQTQRWSQEFAGLPVVHVTRLPRLLLTTKDIVRYDLSLTSREYYSKFVLEFLQVEHGHPGDSLSELLKNGRIRVTKKRLRAAYPMSKDFLYTFTEEHPEVLKHYKESKEYQDEPLSNRMLEAATGEDSEWSVEGLIEELDSIPEGKSGANDYEKLVKRALESIFYPALVHPRAQIHINNGRKIIDMIFDNRSSTGTFNRIAVNLHMSAILIPFECKNYSEDPKNPEIDQLVGRLDRARGRVGVLVCRRVDAKDVMCARCRDVTQQGNGVVLWLEDWDMIQLLRGSNDTVIAWELPDDRVREILEG